MIDSAVVGVTDGRQPFALDLGDRDQTAMGFSPDGKYLALSRSVDGKRQVFWMRTAGGEIRWVMLSLSRMVFEEQAALFGQGCYREPVVGQGQPVYDHERQNAQQQDPYHQSGHQQRA